MTICCAAAEADGVRETAKALEARGYVVELAIGVESDVSVLTTAVETMSGQGLYVLCRSHSLDRTSIDQLREILRNFDVPFGRTLTLAADTQRPRDLEERIVSVLRRMVTGRPDGRPKAWGSSLPPSEEDPDTTIRQPGGAQAQPTPGLLQGLGEEPENADPYASTSQIEFVAQASGGVMPPSYAGADRTAVAPAPLAPQEPPSVPPPLSAPPSYSKRPAAAAAAAAPTSSPGDLPPSLAATAPPSVPMAAPSSLSTLPSAELEIEPASYNGSSAPMVAPSMPGAPSGVPGQVSSAMSAEDDFEPPLTFGGRMGRALASPTGLAAVLGSVALVVLIVVLVSVLGDDDEDQTTAANETEKAEKKAEPKDEPKAAENEDEPEAADGAKAEEPSEPSAEPAAKKDEPAAKKDEPPPVAGIEMAGAVAFVPGEPPPQPPERVDISASDDPPDVAKALRDREVRAIDLFLVAPERGGTLRYSAAVDYCRELDVAGLTGWRVPSIGEINAVATARMLGKAVYWSATPGDTFGDVMLVLNTKKDRISIVTKNWDGAKIVCIRLRQP